MAHKTLPDVLGWHEGDAVSHLQQMGWEVDVQPMVSRRRGALIDEVKRVVRCIERDGKAELIIVNVIPAAKI